jgi:hypothetical protein
MRVGEQRLDRQAIAERRKRRRQILGESGGVELRKGSMSVRVRRHLGPTPGKLNEFLPRHDRLAACPRRRSADRRRIDEQIWPQIDMRRQTFRRISEAVVGREDEAAARQPRVTVVVKRHELVRANWAQPKAPQPSQLALERLWSDVQTLLPLLFLSGNPVVVEDDI